MLIVGSLVAIPAIQNVYDSFGSTATLPAVTLWFKGVLDGLIQFWYIPVGIIAAIVAAIVFYVHTPKGKYNLITLSIKCQYLGN